jgi:hypothetical protein
LFLYYRTDKNLNRFLKAGITSFAQYRFYHFCIGVYLILSFVLFGVSIAYIPFYYHGGFIFVWYCAPMSLLCFISFVKSQQRINVIKNNQNKKLKEK